MRWDALALAVSLLLSLTACNSAQAGRTDAVQGNAAAGGAPAGLPTLPALASLPAAPRRSSSASYDLLAIAPLQQSPVRSAWSAGSLTLQAPNPIPPKPASEWGWAIFA